MSTSPTSKPASPDSPPAGTEKQDDDAVVIAKAKAYIDRKRKDGDDGDDDDGDARDQRRGRGRDGKVEVDLEVSRQRSISWTIGGIVAGILLILHLGTVGVWAGFALVGWGLVHAYLLVNSFVFRPGTIVVSPAEVQLPRGLCKPRPLVVKPSDVTAVYLLRRSVPWNKASPVLVVELGPRAMVFPRDWFASESDQRHIVHALLRHRDDAQGSDARTAR